MQITVNDLEANDQAVLVSAKDECQLKMRSHPCCERSNRVAQSVSCKEERTKSKKCRRTHKRKVSFSKLVEVREYDLVIGNHPDCRDGLPLSLNWNYFRTGCIDGMDKNTNSGESSQKPPPRRLRFAERVDRLQQVTGITDEQLKQHLYDWCRAKSEKVKT